VIGATTGAARIHRRSIARSKRSVPPWDRDAFANPLDAAPVLQRPKDEESAGDD
jgi:hypothetical protein